MTIPHSVNDFSKQIHALPKFSPSVSGINQICYDNASPALLNLLLLPAVKQLGEQAKWMLWLTPENKLDRSWLEHSGISLNKSVQIPLLTDDQKIDSMIRAIKSENYSVITVWLNSTLTVEQQNSLNFLAKESDTVVFILHKNSPLTPLARQITQQKIPTFAFL